MDSDEYTPPPAGWEAEVDRYVKDFYHRIATSQGRGQDDHDRIERGELSFIIAGGTHV
jgi:hypothetical protein